MGLNLRVKIKSVHILTCAFILITGVGAEASLFRVVAYNTANNPDDPTEDAWLTTIFDAIGKNDVGNGASPIDVLAVAETDTGSSARLPGILNTLYSVSSYDVVVSSSDAGNDRTAVVYDSSQWSLIGSANLDTGLTHHVTRVQLRPAGTGGSDDLYVYAIHLKSGSSSSDQTIRAAEAGLIRADADSLGDGANIVFAGDFNMQGSSEGAWSNLTGTGIGRVLDTADAPGQWRDDPAFLDLHTQNPRGNMDDRFDLVFTSDELLDGVGIDYLPGSFRVFGNNGTHSLGGAIDTGTGAAPDVLSALISASDHLPVVADFAIPIPGDANMDGAVTFADFAVLQNHFNQTGGWRDGDFNGDGLVTFADFAILQNHFDHESGDLSALLTAALNLPEPHAGVLLMLAGLGLLRQRTQRAIGPR